MTDWRTEITVELKALREKHPYLDGTMSSMEGEIAALNIERTRLQAIVVSQKEEIRTDHMLMDEMDKLLGYTNNLKAFAAYKAALKEQK